MEGYVLERICKSDPSIKKIYHGLYSMDEDWLPPKSLPACYIINTSRNRSPGEHWVSFYLSNDGTGDYFDSYGTHPIKRIYNWMTKWVQTVRYNTKMLQGPTSRVCWAYVLYFIHMKARNIPMQFITAPFTSYDFSKNDHLALAVYGALL